MMRFKLKIICSCLLAGAISFPVSPVDGQYYNDPAQRFDEKKPLNQLPPIISSKQANSTTPAQGARGLYIPKADAKLPPIVQSGPSGHEAIVPPPIVNAPAKAVGNPSVQTLPNTARTIKTLGPLQPQMLPPITQAPKTTPLPSLPKTLPPITSVTPRNLPPISRGVSKSLPPITQGASKSLPPIAQPTTRSLPPITNAAPPKFIAPSRNTTAPRQISTSAPNLIRPGGVVPGAVGPTNVGPRAISNGGVPIYSNKTPRPVGFRPGGSPARVPFSLPMVQDGSGTRSIPPIVQDSLSPGNIPTLPDVEIDAPSMEPNSIVENGSNSTTEVDSSKPFLNSRIPSTSAPVNGSVAMPGTNDYFEPPAHVGGCIDNGCSSCGAGGCYDPAVVQQQNGCCGSVSSAGRYLFADAIFWTRQDGEVQLSNSFGLNDFNFVGGARFTFGARDNATSGRELTYFGTGDMDEVDSATSATGSLQPLFSPASGISFTQITGFQNANVHRQEKESQLHSLEYNRVRWGWDVLKSLIGIRYIYFDDSYEFFSRSSGGTNGLFVQDSVNNLFGVHGGWELFYDVGYRTSASFQTKFGAYVNAANVDTSLFNAGAQQFGQEEDDSSIASTVELNFMSHFQLSPRSRFRVGYDMFFAWGIFTVENNIPRSTFARGFQTGVPQLSASTGTNLNTNDEALFLHGVSFGFEVFR